MPEKKGTMTSKKKRKCKDLRRKQLDGTRLCIHYNFKNPWPKPIDLIEMRKGGFVTLPILLNESSARRLRDSLTRILTETARHTKQKQKRKS
jgi:hypothetical protein